jgi:uncharacterized membrane protein
MSRFVVAIFPDLGSALEGIRVLKDLASERAVELHGAATVMKGDRGKLTMQVMADDGPALTAVGALLGGLAGLAIGPLAAAVLAAGGAVSGAAAGLTHRGEGRAFAKKVARDLPFNSAAVVAELTAESLDILAVRLEALGGTVVRNETLLPK